MSLQKQLLNYHIILGSGSPRRKELLHSLSIPFKSIVKETDEQYPKKLHLSEITGYIANKKANAFSLHEKEILITADTMVFLGNTPLGKPQNRNHCIEMLISLAGKKHTVITSVCLKSIHKTSIFHDTTLIECRNFTRQEATWYTDNFHPYDKAGGYGIQEWFGKTQIIKIEGSFYNVMGLLIHMLYTELLYFIKQIN